MLQDQLRLLEAVQNIDLELEESERALEELPRRLKALGDDLARVEGILEDERRRLAEANACRVEREQLAEAERNHLQKSKAKLAQVRNSREYLAAQREFEHTRRSSGDREGELEKLREAIAQFESSIATHEEALASLRTHFEEEEAATQQRIGELQQMAASGRAKRAEMAESVRRDVLRRYDSIRRRRGGRGLVVATSGVCTGCNMHLPPQLYNIIQRAGSVEQCPNCQRIIYYGDLGGEADTGTAEG